MQKITPFLWFDTNAEAAMQLYVSSFSNSEVLHVHRMGDGQVMTASFRIAGLDVMALNGGPQYAFTPATSFSVSCETEDELNALWARLSDGGMVMMELDRYPFAERFGWTMDRFGLSWQLTLTGEPQSVAPFLMFVGEQHGRAEDAMTFYTSLFDNSAIGAVDRYGPDDVDAEGTVKHATFTLSGQTFKAIDSGYDHAFTFTPAFSLFVSVEGQDEVDEFWNRFTEGGEPGDCGWLKDRFGLSWQIIPTALGQLMQDEDPERANRVVQAMLQMHKIDIAALQRARDNPTFVASASAHD